MEIRQCPNSDGACTEYWLHWPTTEKTHGAGKNMSVILARDRLLHILLIILSSQCNSFPLGNSINHGVLLGLEKLERHENNNNPGRLNKKWSELEYQAFAKASFSKEEKILFCIKQSLNGIHLGLFQSKSENN